MFVKLKILKTVTIRITATPNVTQRSSVDGYQHLVIRFSSVQSRRYILKMEAANTSETLVPIYQTTHNVLKYRGITL
jgi:hypothetical protein